MCATSSLILRQFCNLIAIHVSAEIHRHVHLSVSFTVARIMSV